MDLQLGTPARTLIDGAVDWNDVAEAALSVWNPYLNSGVQFQAVRKTVTPKERDHVNSVFFSSTIYGESFGDDTLAVTISFYDASTDLKTEADVLVNSAQPYDSYRGLLRNASGGGRLYDLRRVAIHEFGHVLGLEHVAQGVVSIMRPVISDLDTVQADDMAGAEAIYGGVLAAPVITSSLNVNVGVGQAISYRITASHGPTSYQVSGLPAGLSFDAPSGVISGVVTANGIYEIVVSATNANGTGRATVNLTVSTLPVITSSLHVVAELGKPFRYLITASPQATSFEASGLQAGFTLNADTGLISGAPTAVGSYALTVSAINGAGTGNATLRLDCAFDGAASQIHQFSGPDGAVPTAEMILASDGNLYGTTVSGGANDQGTIFRCTPDGTVTTIHSFAGPDGEGPTAALFQASDGNLYGTTKYGGASYTSGINSSFSSGYGSIFRCTPDGTFTTIHSFNLDEIGAYPTSALAQGADGNLYGSTTITASAYNNGGTIFRITPDGVLTVAHSFNGTTSNQASALILATDGNLYGTTNSGSNGGQIIFSIGTFFKLATDGTFTILYSFDGTTAGNPSGHLVQAGDGNFYGIAASHDLNGPGVIYRVTPSGGFSVLHGFENYTQSKTPLVQGVDGNFYGTTGNYGSLVKGIECAGSIIKMTPDGTTSTVHYFASADGIEFSGLVQGTDGEFYGTASDSRRGSIFKTALISDPRKISLPTVALVAPAPAVVAGSGGFGEFDLALSEVQTSDVIVNFTIKGSAVNGQDYVLLKSTKTIKAGKLSKLIKISPLGNLGGASKKVVTLVLAPGDGYTVGTDGKVKVKILAAR